MKDLDKIGKILRCTQNDKKCFMTEDLKSKIEELKTEIRRLGGIFGVEEKKIRVKELEFEFSDPDFWKNRETADAKIKEIGELNELIKKINEIENNLSKINTDKFSDEDKNLLFETERKIRQLEIENLFKGKYDKQAAVISVFSGAGGDESEDWAGMLYEMYAKFAERRGWKVSLIDETEGVVGKTAKQAFKNATFEIKGQYAYGYLKKESGVHRLVRVSPYSAEDKRHTSFALVEVMPDLPEIDENAFEISPDDLKIDFMRAGGPGGQNVNKVESAVRIVHIPTGVAVSSRVERSQEKNRVLAMKLLKAKLIKLMEEQKAKEVGELRTKVKPEWGNQIRSYVLNPYKMVKDHRTNIETTQADKVLNGDLDMFVEAEL